MGCFVFGNLTLSDDFEVLGIEMPAMAPTAPDLRPIPGRDGAVLAGNDLGPLEIKVTARIATDTIDPRDIQQIWADKVAPIRNAGEQLLKLTADRGRMAVLTGESPLEYATYSATGTLTFTCQDPIAYGASRTENVPSGGSKTFTVGGTAPAMPTITANAVRNSTSLVWGIRLDGGDFVHIATGSASSRSVVVDCAARTCTVAGTATLPTLDSDWLALEPGEHTLAMDYGTASGGATVTFTERWL